MSASTASSSHARLALKAVNGNLLPPASLDAFYGALDAGVGSHVPVAHCGGVRAVGPGVPSRRYSSEGSSERCAPGWRGSRRTIRRVPSGCLLVSARLVRSAVSAARSLLPFLLLLPSWLFWAGSAGCHNSGIPDALNTADCTPALRRATTLKPMLRSRHSSRNSVHPAESVRTRRGTFTSPGSSPGRWPAAQVPAQGLHSPVEHFCVIGDAVRGGVAGPQHHTQDLLGDIGGAVHRVEPVPLAASGGSLLVLQSAPRGRTRLYPRSRPPRMPG